MFYPRKGCSGRRPPRRSIVSCSDLAFSARKIDILGSRSRPRASHWAGHEQLRVSCSRARSRHRARDQ